jgi:hypothetical protein
MWHRDAAHAPNWPPEFVRSSGHGSAAAAACASAPPWRARRAAPRCAACGAAVGKSSLSVHSEAAASCRPEGQHAPRAHAALVIARAARAQRRTQPAGMERAAFPQTTVLPHIRRLAFPGVRRAPQLSRLAAQRVRSVRSRGPAPCEARAGVHGRAQAGSTRAAQQPAQREVTRPRRAPRARAQHAPRPQVPRTRRPVGSAPARGDLRSPGATIPKPYCFCRARSFLFVRPRSVARTPKQRRAGARALAPQRTPRLSVSAKQEQGEGRKRWYITAAHTPTDAAKALVCHLPVCMTQRCRRSRPRDACLRNAAPGW